MNRSCLTSAFCFRCPEDFHFNGESEDIEFCEMQEGDETDLFWEAINEPTHQRKYGCLLNGNNSFENLLNVLFFFFI